MLSSIALYDWKFGATVMLTYWIGRTLPMWFGPMLTFGRSDEELLGDIQEADLAYRHSASAGMALVSFGIAAELFSCRTL